MQARHSLWIALVAAGCGPSVYECAEDSDEGNPAAYEVVVPRDGRVVAGPWSPVLVRVGSRDAARLVTTCLDGQPADDPLGLVRQRRTAFGGGWDYLGYLDLLSVTPGEHHLLVAFARRGGGWSLAQSTFTHDPPPHRLRVEVRDERGQPTAARVVVTDGTDRIPVVTLPNRADPANRDRQIYSLFAVDGVAEALLEPGSYRLLVVRGIRDHLAEVEVVLAGDTTVQVVVEPAVELPDHLAADLHVHTGRSYDSFLPDRLRWQSLLAAGLDVVVVTDHNEVVDPAPGLGVMANQVSPLRGLPGVEHDLRHPTSANWDLGHMNAFPVLGSDEAPLPKKELEIIGRALGDFRVRQEQHPYPGVGGEVVLQLNHARGIHFFPDRPPNRGAWPLFERLGYDRDVPVGEGSNAWMLEADPATGATAMDFDALEIVNRFSWELYLDLRQDWFTFLNQGFFMTGTGNSDSHAMEVEVAGFPVNLVRAPRPAPGEALDAGAFVGALRQGAVLVSTGPVVDLVLETPFSASSPGDVVSFTGTALARVRVQAAPWVPVDEVRLVVGGDVVQRWEVPAPEAGVSVDMEVVWPIGIAADTWVVAEAGWPLESSGEQPHVGGDYGLVAPGYVPLGFTNPVRIDGDGDGRWSAF